MNPHVRRTSIYKLTVQGDPLAGRRGDQDLLSELIQRCPETITDSGWYHSGEVFIRFRVAGDAEAVRAAQIAADGLEYRLETGFGISNRIVDPASSARQG